MKKMKTTGNNKLSQKQVDSFREKAKYIKEKTGNKYQKLLALVNKCLKNRDFIPISEYRQFTKIYAELFESSFPEQVVNNNKEDAIPTINTPTVTVTEQDIYTTITKFCKTKQQANQVATGITELFSKIWENLED